MRAVSVSKLALSLVSASLLLAPPPASARDWDDDDQGHYGRSDWDGHHHKQYKRGHARRHDHGDWCPPRQYRPRVYRAPAYYYDPPPAYYYGRPVRQARYYCEPCDHWYGTQTSFHYHVRHQHGIAQALLPAVIVATVFGAVFSGY